MSSRIIELEQILRPTVAAMGYEWWGVEWVGQSASRTLRLYIDHVDGINIEDCAKVSRQISALLDIHSGIGDRYHLEVSSPGMDRKFFNFEQLTPYVGQLLVLKTRQPINGRSRFKGKLSTLDTSVTPALTMCLDEGKAEEQIYRIEFANVDSLRLIPVF